VRSDVTIGLIVFYSWQYDPKQFYLVKYWDGEQKRKYIFLTNTMHISTLQVAELYKKIVGKQSCTSDG